MTDPSTQTAPSDRSPWTKWPSVRWEAYLADQTKFIAEHGSTRTLDACVLMAEQHIARAKA